MFYPRRLLIRSCQSVKCMFRQINHATMLAAATATMGTNDLETTLSSNFNFFDEYAIKIPIHGKNVGVLQEPAEFYTTLSEEILKAKRRIVLSALYLGTGELEKELVNCILQSCSEQKSNDNFRVDVLLDFNRGSRGKENSRTMLLPLLKQFPNHANLALYHTPELRGAKKRLIPERFNEIFGLQHIKAYIVDDNLILSGQDRYIIFRNCPALADYFHRLILAVSSVSFVVDGDNNYDMHEDCDVHPFREETSADETAFAQAAGRAVSDVVYPWSSGNLNPKLYEAISGCSSRTNKELKEEMVSFWNRLEPPQTDAEGARYDTMVYPIVQMGLFNIWQEDKAIQALFNELPDNGLVRLATGYFNMPDLLQTLMAFHFPEGNAYLLRDNGAYDVITASPKANGFYQSKGISAAIPTVYSLYFRNFAQRVRPAKERVSLYEYYREGWTFHAKGLWCYIGEEKFPTVTFIGSSNFGMRSLERDLEAQAIVVTENMNLRESLHKEQCNVFEFGEKRTAEDLENPTPNPPFWISLFYKMVRSYF